MQHSNKYLPITVSLLGISSTNYITPSPASYAPSSLCKSANRSYAKVYAKLM